MLDIQFIRENKEKVKEAAKNKNRDVDIDKILELDELRRNLIQQSQNLREERNNLTGDTKPSPEVIDTVKKLKIELKTIEEKLRTVEEELHNLMLYVPNVPLDEVPIGRDEKANVEIKTWGEPKTFSFEPKDHIELATNLDLMDLDKGSKVSGFRGYFLKNEAAQLHLALMFYVFQKLIQKGYTPMIAPSIVKEFALFGTGHFPWGSEQDVYSLNDEDMYLSGTAEIPLTAYHSNDILTEKDLPKKYVGFSPCFRREAGAYGKDTRGLYRLHEFWKIEQVIIGRNDVSEAKEIHEELQKNAEEILQDLNLPYRVLLMSTGDMGEPQLKKYDTETWMPSRQTYGETMSNSIMGDFQARRLNIRYKTKDGQMNYAFTFNNTAVASPRILIALLENYQREDGSIEIPEVLHPLLPFKEISKR